jgi:hypothetical protein
MQNEPNFGKMKNEPNPLSKKELRRKMPPPTTRKTNPIKPNFQLVLARLGEGANEATIKTETPSRSRVCDLDFGICLWLWIWFLGFVWNFGLVRRSSCPT